MKNKQGMTRNDYIKAIFSGTHKWQFGTNPTTVKVIETKPHVGHLTYIDGYKDPNQYQRFTEDIGLFAEYLFVNNARIHWTLGA